MSQPFLGMIAIFPFNFAPRGWAFCNGQLLPISQNQALFSLLGTTYGGNGVQTFALPDLRGRTPVDAGLGYVQGEQAGEEGHAQDRFHVRTGGLRGASTGRAVIHYVGEQ